MALCAAHKGSQTHLARCIYRRADTRSDRIRRRRPHGRDPARAPTSMLTIARAHRSQAEKPRIEDHPSCCPVAANVYNPCQRAIHPMNQSRGMRRSISCMIAGLFITVPFWVFAYEFEHGGGRPIYLNDVLSMFFVISIGCAWLCDEMWN